MRLFRLFGFLILASFFLFLVSAASVEAAVSKILVVPSQTSATIYWTSSSKEPSSVTYGILSGALIKAANDPIPVSFHSLTLSPLVPNTTYYFHIATQSSKSKEDFALYSSFKTPGQQTTNDKQPTTSLFTRNLKQGDTSADVKQLQKILNSNPKTQVARVGPGSLGLETMYFGPATKRAVSRFQELYKSEILTPNGLLKGTGLFGVSTRTKANSLLALANSKGQIATAKPTVSTPTYGVGGGSAGSTSSPQGGSGGGSPSSGNQQGGGGSPSPSPTPTPTPTFTPPAAGPSPAPTPSPTPSPTYVTPTLTPTNTECVGNITNDFNTTTGLGCFGPNYQKTNTDYGFTIFRPSADTLIVYVSSSDGSDTNDGLSPQTSVKTIERGYQIINGPNDVINQIRVGNPDWLLLKRGDSWVADLGGKTWINTEYRWVKGGRSASEPALIGSYGTAVARPIVKGQFQPDVDYVAITGIHLQTPGFDLGVKMSGPRAHLLVEDCDIEGFFINFLLQAARNVTIRRSIVRDAHGDGTGRPQGIFAKDVADLTLEENVIDQNGWKPGAQEETIFNHNIYTGGVVGATVRGNIFSRASSFGLTGSPIHDAVINNNLFLADANAMVFGVNDLADPNSNLTITNNVLTRMGRTITGNPQSFGILVDSANGVNVSDNYLIDTPFVGSTASIRLSNAQTNASVIHNIIYNWNGGTDPIDGTMSKTNVVMTPNHANLPASAFVNPTRTIDTYAQSLGLANMDAFLISARQLSRFTWNSAYTADSFNNYIRAGFAFAGGQPPPPSAPPAPPPAPSPSPSASPTPTPPPNANCPGLSPANGLVAYYSFESDACDQSGNFNTGTLTGGPTFTSGHIGSALSFDGSNDYVDVTNASNLQITDTITVAAWVNIGTVANNKNIVSKGDYFTSGKSWTIQYQTDNTLIFNIEQSNAQASLTSAFRGVWHHIVGTYEKNAGSNQMKLYVDGIQVGQGTRSSAIPSTSDDVRIGTDISSSSFFTGQVDEVRIYNRALSASDVTTLYNN